MNFRATVRPESKEETEMVNRNNKMVAGKINKSNEHENSRTSDNLSQLLPTRNLKTTETPTSDDLIISLSDAYENKRARQVFEWERVRRQNVQRAA